MLALSIVVAGVALSVPAGVSYELQEGSTLTFTNLATGVTDPIVITVDIRGEFCRIPTSDTGVYALRRVCFRGENSTTPVSVRGRGRYQMLTPCGIPERMILNVDIEGFPQPVDVPIVLDSGEVWLPGGRFPTIIIDLEQRATTADWHYSMHLIAIPRRSVDFSTEMPFAAHDSSGVSYYISDGDLLNDSGRIVRTNRQLTRNLGIMPPAPDIGLDAVTKCPWCPAIDCADDPTRPCRCRLFSSEYTVWSETLSRWLNHGDLLCECGSVVRTNAELIQAFAPVASAAGVGLDAVHAVDGEEFWFSTEEGFWGHTSSGALEWIRPDDLLSDRGYVVKTNEQLLENFTPLATVAPLGLDAVVVRPNGEIYFSVEVGFIDAVYGRVSEGDLLSDSGYIVARNWELVAGFHPANNDDVGLDAVDLDTEQPCRNVVPSLQAVDPAGVLADQ
jgi:hypothetical protein